MKKIVLFIFIIFSIFNLINAMEQETSEWNKNFIQLIKKVFLIKKHIDLPNLPDEIWYLIAEKLINLEEIESAETLPELYNTMKDLRSFCFISKKNSQIFKNLIEKKFTQLNEKSLKEFFIRKKDNIFQKIKMKLKNDFFYNSFDWFNNINDKDNFGFTALHYVSLHNRVEIAKLLIQNGVNINFQNINGETALMTAAEKNNKEIVKLLISKGANIDIQDSKGWTALFWAVRDGHEEIINLLIQNGANIDIKDEEGRTALIYADLIRRYTIKLLLERYKEEQDIKNQNDKKETDNDDKTEVSFVGRHECIVQ